MNVEVPSHWQMQIYFTLSAISLTDSLILDDVYFIVRSFSFMAVISCLHLLKQKIKCFDLRKVLTLRI